MRWGGINADFLPRAPTLELHHPMNEGKEGVILTQAHVETRKEFCATLTKNDGPSLDGFTAIGFDPEVLGIAVPPVS